MKTLSLVRIILFNKSKKKFGMEVRAMLKLFRKAFRPHHGSVTRKSHDYIQSRDRAFLSTEGT
jgi:hypothetical protein